MKLVRKISWVSTLLTIAAISVAPKTMAATGPSANSVQRLIVFGDSLSDVGTYLQTAGPVGGGKFTTNPGKLWIELVADKLNLPLQPDREEGLGAPLKLVGGYDYAQGGARVRIAPATSSTPGLSARPLSQQLAYFLKEHTAFHRGDLVFVQGGANDLFAQLAGVQAGTTLPADAIKNMDTVARQFVRLVFWMKFHGARHIEVLNLPAIEQTPFALSTDASSQALIKMMVQTFNGRLADGVKFWGAHMIDINTFDHSVDANYKQYGFTDIADPACKIAELPSNSSLFCSSATLVTSGADLTYKFADTVHPTTGFSKVIGDFVIAQLGWR